MENTLEYLKYIDFKKSTFFLGNLARFKESPLEINSIEDYNNCKKNIGFKTINFELLHFSEKFENQNQDLFYINYLHNDFFVSQKLKVAIESNSVSGMNIYEPKFIIS